MGFTPAQLALLSNVVQRRAGIALASAKPAFVTGKLAPVAARFGFRNVSALLDELADEPEELAAAVTEAMTTNETSFFRDRACFNHFQNEILPALIEARASARRLRIWCAAASTGQEPYSLAMILDEEKLLEQGWKIDLFATDLSESAVDRIREGVYTQHEIERGLTAARLSRYFTRDGTNWRIAERLRCALRVRRFNLLDHYGWLGQLDAIFCRNVFLYFDHQSKLEVLMRLERALAPDGWLVLGASESAGSCTRLVSGAVRGVYVRGAPQRPMRMAG
ncbi:MAG: protein-glutamate O-methyltransferase CheR [Alphaproteobacteria bacterium]|nr:protein-glutamate O-methyltransferase CheR [Alphaproteobacteria bacterium]MBU6473635.1 protein-glutamate O-methyltransferase CheR [Alphaproteobacteria bacterium]MDE2013664.1 protein-glutamate O-methyltransferase CheR [Alphaproteobacteria bacterium]MDE2072712.1 protein-glutamate O-methyltransferase CheR [Alphaproteobacteria bacterium]